jgi:hypothetical protein
VLQKNVQKANPEPAQLAKPQKDLVGDQVAALGQREV